MNPEFRVLEWEDNEYLLASNQSQEGMVAYLPEGEWKITRYDCIDKEEQVLAETANGIFSFHSPDSRAVIFHFKKNQGLLMNRKIIFKDMDIQSLIQVSHKRYFSVVHSMIIQKFIQ